jgi:hypothetical protein
MTQLRLGISDTRIFLGRLSMRTTVIQAAPEISSARIEDVLAAQNESHGGGWREIVQRVSTYMSKPTSKSPTAPETTRQVTELLRLQMDVTRYQLRVEVVSKIAESGVASLRKLQQSQ